MNQPQPSSRFTSLSGVRSGRGRYLLNVGILVAAYFVGAKIGLHLAYANRNVTAVWPPTGISVACLLLMGFEVAPGIYLGAFLANLSNRAGLDASLLIAIGNTLAPLAAAALLTRLVRIRTDLARVGDVAALVLLGGPVSMTVSATMGTASLVVAGGLPLHSYWSTWPTWWVGDSVGVVIFAPLILLVVSGCWREIDLHGWTLGEALTLAGGLVAASFGVFSLRVPVVYLLFPLAVWASVRLLQMGAVMAVAIVSSVSIAETVNGHGPFVAGLSTTGSLLALQAFNGVLALTALILAALTLQARQAEAELRSNAAELERRVAARTSELEISLISLREAQEALVRKEKLSALGEMAGVVGHELRNPLAAVVNGAYLLREGLGDTISPSIEKYLALIERSTKQAAGLSEQLMAYVRVRAPELVRLQVASVLSDVLDASPPPDGIDVSLEADSVALTADRDQLLQILTNLFTNAYQAMPAGGSLRITASETKERVEITVEDSGEGIEREAEGRIFDPFFTTKTNGTGLGLAIVKQLVEAHGGSVSVASRAQGGARATIRLPSNNAHPVSPGGESPVVQRNSQVPTQAN